MIKSHCHCFILQHRPQHCVICMYCMIRLRVMLKNLFWIELNCIIPSYQCAWSVSKGNAAQRPRPCRSLMELPQTLYTVQDPEKKPRWEPVAGVPSRAGQVECLCEERGRTKGSLRRCTWLTPACALAVDWLHCRPSGTKQKHCDMCLASAGLTGSSPWSVSPSRSSVMHTGGKEKHWLARLQASKRVFYWKFQWLKKQNKKKHIPACWFHTADCICNLVFFCGNAELRGGFCCVVSYRGQSPAVHV